MARFSAFLDTCVLVPIVSADVLLRLAEAALYRPLWSSRVLEELEYVLLELHPKLADGGKAAKRIAAMHASFPDATVEHWQPLENTLVLPDPDDRHVLAAAIRGRADVIVTNNAQDFPAEMLKPLGLDTKSLDDFLLDQLDLAPSQTLTVLHELALAAQRPPLDVHDVLTALARAGAERFAEAAEGLLA